MKFSGTFISGIEKRFPKQETKQMLSLWNPARKKNLDAIWRQLSSTIPNGATNIGKPF